MPDTNFGAVLAPLLAKFVLFFLSGWRRIPHFAQIGAFAVGAVEVAIEKARCSIGE